jgi:hypothetical protein
MEISCTTGCNEDFTFSASTARIGSVSAKAASGSFLPFFP